MRSAYPTPKKYIAKLAEKNHLNFRVDEVIFDVIDPAEFIIIPGQFINLHVGEGTFRSYSIASSYNDKKQISLLVEVGHEGIGANFTKNLKVGDSVDFIGPSGRFCLPEQIESNIVFVATGTGLAPILSMLDYLVEQKCESQIELYFGARNTEETFKLNFLELCKKHLKNFKYTLCYSNPTNEAEKTYPNVACGRVTELADTSHVNDCSYLLCGHPYMISDMLKILTEKGVKESNIFHERFTVAKK